MTLNGIAANTFTGLTTVNTGTLLLNDSGGAAISGNLTVGDSLGGQGATKADVVRLLASNQIATTAAVTVNSSGLLDLSDGGTAISNTIGTGQTTALTLAGGTVNLGTSTLTINSDVADQSNAANITPATISGTGTWHTGTSAARRASSTLHPAPL